MKKKMLILLGLMICMALVFLIPMTSCQEEAAGGEGSSDSSEEDVSNDASDVVVEEGEDVIAVAEESDASCIDCHNDTTLIFSREIQWENSLHGSGMTFERNGADCATCHTSEGFNERIALGTFEISEDVENPSPINCRTCHDIHETYTSSDWALATDEAVTFELTGDVYDAGNSNLCATCHQPRPSDVPQEGGGDFEITSTRFGPHHGPQSSMISGVGGYGDGYDGLNVHYEDVENGCISCHMTDTAYGKQAGGHTMNVSYEYHGEMEDYLVGCIECHYDIESIDHNGLQTDIESMLEEVRELLVEQGLIDGESGSGITGTFTSEQAGALWNYKTIEEDRSLGVHNPGFAKYLLETALDALK